MLRRPNSPILSVSNHRMEIAIEATSSAAPLAIRRPTVEDWHASKVFPGGKFILDEHRKFLLDWDRGGRLNT